MVGDQEEVPVLIFVEDVISVGSAENVRKAIGSMLQIEMIKKFT